MTPPKTGAQSASVRCHSLVYFPFGIHSDQRRSLIGSLAHYLSISTSVRVSVQTGLYHGLALSLCLSLLLLSIFCSNAGCGADKLAFRVSFPLVRRCRCLSFLCVPFVEALDEQSTCRSRAHRQMTILGLSRFRQKRLKVSCFLV